MPANAATLNDFLALHEKRGGVHAELAATVKNLAAAAIDLERQISDGTLTRGLASEGDNNVQGEVQKRLDVIAHQAFHAAAKRSPIAWFLSEEFDHVMTVNAGGSLALAIDPLDGSANIAINGTIGTIFAIYPAIAGCQESSFLQPGRKLLAAGYFIYGAQTELAISFGEGTYLFALDGNRHGFVATGRATVIPKSAEFAINASNYRHWPRGYQVFFDDCLKGADGQAGRNFNMRWIAALVGDAHRILRRGGLYMYPADSRRSYENGRLRLIYECSPIAFLIEQAGGSASDGKTPILDLVPTAIHQRVSLCFGSAKELERLHGYMNASGSDTSPLFGERGLFRAMA
jgi:fructose-1,6-bisphosphatase I